MIPLDLPPQIEMQIVEIAKAQNISVNEYILAKLTYEPTMEEKYAFLGLNPFTTGKHVITNDYINELREQHGI